MLHPNAAIATSNLPLLQFLTHDHAAVATKKIALRTTAKFKRRRARLHSSINPRSPTIPSRFSHNEIPGSSPKHFGNMSVGICVAKSKFRIGCRPAAEKEKAGEKSSRFSGA
jgi:hypothetical protein